jgi:hypothetical protein
MSELQKAVADMLVKATQAAEAAGKFAVEQLPDVAHQYVMYVGILATIGVVVGLGFLVLTVWCWSSRPLGDGKFFGGAGACLVGAGLVLCNLSTAIMAWVAPKVLLIKWAAELVK